MGWNDFTDNDKDFLNKGKQEILGEIGGKTWDISQRINTKSEEINNNVNKLLGDVNSSIEGMNTFLTSKLNNLKDTGTTILDEPSLQRIFDDVKTSFETEKEKLSDIIETFKTEIQKTTKKYRELCEQEIHLIKLQAAADVGFADRIDTQLGPLKELQAALEKKREYLVTLQNDYAQSITENEEKRINDFKELKNQLTLKFKELSNQANEREILLTNREIEFNLREETLIQREEEVRNGLSQERTIMLSTITAKNQNLIERENRLKIEKEKFSKQQKDFKQEQDKLLERVENITKREKEADADFPERRKKLLEEIQEIKANALKEIAGNQKEDSIMRNKIFEDVSNYLQTERSRIDQTISNEQTQRWIEFNNQIAQRKELLETKEKDLQEYEILLKQKEKKIDEQKESLNQQIIQLNQQKSAFSIEKKEIYKKYKSIASIQIDAARSEIIELTKIIESLRKQLLDLQFKYEEQRSINDKFNGRSADDIFDQLNSLEAKNEKLLLDLKNLRSSQKK